nr:uncharacterized protein LOC109178471 [Ipomoea batatas]
MHISVEIFKEEAELEDDCDVHSIATGRCPPVFPPVSVKQESALIQCCSFNLWSQSLKPKDTMDVDLKMLAKLSGDLHKELNGSSEDPCADDLQSTSAHGP